MIGGEDVKTVGLGALVGFVLVGAFVAGAFVEMQEDAPRIGRVRLNELTAEYMAGAVGTLDSEAEAAAAVRAWATNLEIALERVAEERGVVLLPAEAVIAGAPDYTQDVRSRMNASQPVAGGASGGARGAETAQ